MNRWKMRGVAVLAVLSLAIVGCQEQGVDDLESLDALPSLDMTMPSHGGMESMDAMPSGS